MIQESFIILKNLPSINRKPTKSSDFNFNSKHKLYKINTIKNPSNLPYRIQNMDKEIK